MRRYLYELSPNGKRGLVVIARLHGGAWLVSIRDVSDATFDERGAQFGLAEQSLRPDDVAGESLAGRSAHVLDAARLGKLDELVAAETLKEAVNDLALPTHLRDPLPIILSIRDTGIARAEAALDKFETAFKYTLSRELTWDDGAQLEGVINALRERFTGLKNICQSAAEDMDRHDPVQIFDKQWREKIRVAVVDMATS